MLENLELELQRTIADLDASMPSPDDTGTIREQLLARGIDPASIPPWPASLQSGTDGQENYTRIRSCLKRRIPVTAHDARPETGDRYDLHPEVYRQGPSKLGFPVLTADEAAAGVAADGWGHCIGPVWAGEGAAPGSTAIFCHTPWGTFSAATASEACMLLLGAQILVGLDLARWIDQQPDPRPIWPEQTGHPIPRAIPEGERAYRARQAYLLAECSDEPIGEAL